MYNYFLTFLLAFTFITSFDKIEGKITDFYTHESLPGVAISINDKILTYSDLDGNFIIKQNKQDSVYYIKASLISYTTSLIEINKTEFNKNLNIKLKQK